MSVLRFALPMLAVAGSAYASCSASATATIQNAGDAMALATCTTFSGSIAIATGTTEDIALNGVKTIKGDFIVDGVDQLVRLSGTDLETITGKFTVNNDSQIAALTFPKLNEVDSMTLSGLPNLRSLGFDGQVTKCSSLDVENTNLQDLNGINLEEAEVIIIANNNEITNISMAVANITSKLDLSYNNADVAVSFPNLESANNISLRAIGSLDIPALSNINDGDFGIFESNIETINAPNLTKVDKAFVLLNNKNLNNVTFPKLETVGADLRIANNTNLHDLTGFPKLKEVDAALDMSGNITKVSTPSLNFVKGVFNLQSTGDFGTVCQDFYQPLKDKGKLASSKFKCEGNLKEAKTAGGSSSSSGGSGKTGAAVSLSAPSLYLGVAGLLAVFVGFA